jgi:hypothetical protein
VNAHPLFGIGYGTRILNTVGANARTLDDQWLGTVIETGLVGAFAWVWLFVRIVRRIGAEARADPSERGLLLTALVGAVTGFAISLITYDAFSFVQVTILFYLLVAFATILVPVTRTARAPSVAREPDPVRPARGTGIGLIAVATGLLLFVLVQVASVRHLSLVLVVMCIGAWGLEAGRRRQLINAPTRPPLARRT